MQNDVFELVQIAIYPGEKRNVYVKISELYTTTPVSIPVTVINGVNRGPVLLVTSATHGNELNGIEIIRRLRQIINPRKLHGTLLLAPILNPLSFLTKQRDMPDGADLNRAFPGVKDGRMSSHLAYIIFNKIVKKANYLIDIHSSAPGKTNYPHVRADMSKKKIAKLAKAFGVNIIFNNRGEKGTLRRQANAGKICAITYEAGEPLRFEEEVVEKGLQGIKNVMARLKMYNFRPRRNLPQIIAKKHKWVRAKSGGILVMKVKPGEIVKKDQTIAVCSNPYGSQQRDIRAPYSGIVVGLATLPMAMPGSAVCHLAKLSKKQIKLFEKGDDKRP